MLEKANRENVILRFGLHGNIKHFLVISWQSEKSQRVVKCAMASETLVQVAFAEVCYWIASLLNEMLYVMRCAICYHLYNFKNVRNTHGGVLLLVKLQAKS